MKFLFSILLLPVLVCFPSYGIAQNIFDTSIIPADARIGEYVPLLKNKRVAIVINQTSVVGEQSLLDIMLTNNIQVKKIFVPEHGFRGNEDAGAHIDNSVDGATGLAVISLYGSHKAPTPAELADVDVMVYDLQDVGVRFYTYISTMQYCLEACANAQKQFVILDRPNPNGFYVDGPVLQNEYKSFVGMQPIPVVYGMTVGEYAKMLIGEGWLSTSATPDLTVVQCLNYTHSALYRLPVAPSPNLKNMAAVYAYPSLCLFEGTPISVGRGTDKPFMQYGCPEFGGTYTYHFTPLSMPGAKKPPFENKICYGSLIGNTPAAVLKLLNSSFQISWLLSAYSAYPDKDKFFTPFFNKLYGSSLIVTQIKEGATEKDIISSWQNDLDKFRKIRRKYLSYPDFL